MTTKTQTKLLLSLTLSGNCPSKKNGQNILKFGARNKIVPGQNYLQWAKVQMQALGLLFPHLEPLAPATRKGSKKLWSPALIKERFGIVLLLYAPDRTAGDLTNKAESIMDVLVDARIIHDDNWHEADEVPLKFGGVDKQNPRVEVLIYRLDPVTALDGFIAGLQQQVRVDHVT